MLFHWRLRTLGAAFLISSVSALAGAPEGIVTQGQTCRELGLRYAKCAMGAAAGKACPKDWNFSEPDRCKSNNEFDLGIAEGTRLARGEAPRSTQGVHQSSSVSGVERKTERKRTRFTAAECRLMGREVPPAARELTSPSFSIDQLRRGIDERTDTPGAGEAVVSFLFIYNEKSLRAFSYEMAGDFERKCNGGSIHPK